MDDFGLFAGIILFVAVLFGLAVFLPIELAASEDARYNSWTSRCRSDGGAVQETEHHIFSTHYECYKDGKIIDHED